MPPTDFSYVKPEGWEAMKPEFEKAEKKWQQKVDRKELPEETGKKMIDLMWKKYDHWSKENGKGKEDQTVIQKTVKASMTREARVGRVQLVDILNAVTDGTVSSPTVFAQTLEMNKITDSEFFDIFAQDVKRFHQLYPRQLINYFNDLFESWGYPEMKAVTEVSTAATAPRVQAPESLEVRQPEPQAPEKAPPPAPEPKAPPSEPEPKAPPSEPEPKAPAPDVSQVAPEAPAFPVEPSPWPDEIPKPKPAADGKGTRWYVQYVKPGEGETRALIADDLGRQEALSLIYQMQQNKFQIRQFKPISGVAGATEAPAKAPEAAPAPAAPAPAAPEAETPASGVTTGEMPDPNDPKSYSWRVSYKTKSGHISSFAPTYTGAELQRTLSRWEQMGIHVTSIEKIASASGVKNITQRAQNDMPEDKFKSGAPIIFIDDVSLEFEAINTRGQIKKNMTGKIKRSDDHNYIVDIAGQLYRVPKEVAEVVMDVFVAEIAVDESDLEEPEEKKPEAPAPAPGQAAPGQAAPGQAPSGPELNTDLSKAPQPIETGASIDDDIVIAELKHVAVKMKNNDVAAAFADGQSSGESGTMFIEGDTIYSYGHHFPIATRSVDEGGIVYLTTRTYSVTTSVHIGLVYRALRHMGDEIIESESRSPDGLKIIAPQTEEDKPKVSRTEKDEKGNAREERRRKKMVPSDDPGQYAPSGGGSEAVFETPADVPALSESQMQARIQDIEDQLLRETDPNRQKKLHERLDRMKQAKFDGMVVIASTYEERYGEQILEGVVDALHHDLKLPDSYHIPWSGDTYADPISSPDWMASGEPSEVKNIKVDVYDSAGEGERGNKVGVAIFDLNATSQKDMEKWPGTSEEWNISNVRFEPVEPSESSIKSGSALTVVSEGGQKADFSDLKKEIEKQDREKFKIEETDTKVRDKRRLETSSRAPAFADLLLMIEQEAPGVPSEIGKRLYRSDAAVSRITKATH